MDNNVERNRLLEAQSWLAEYESLQSERLESQRYAGMLTEINIIAVGVIVGLVVTADIYAFAFLLTMSLVCSCLGLLWVAQNRQILSFSNYVTSIIAPALRELVGNQEILNAESSKHLPVSAYFPGPLKGILGVEGKEDTSPDQPARLIIFSPVIELLIFFVPSVSGLLLAVYGITSSEPWYWYCTLLLVVSLLLIIALGVTGLRWLKEMHRKAPVEEFYLDDMKQED